MRKIILILIVLIITSSIFANEKRSISTNFSIVANSVAFEYKINKNTQVSIPFGMNLLEYYGDDIPPVYVGILIEHALNENIPSETVLQLKVGYGLAALFNFNELSGVNIPNHIFIPVISGQLEMFISENHSLYFRTTPPLALISTENGIEINMLGSENIFDYMQKVEVLSLMTFSVGYRYTYD
jgi:hypothetical protein